MYNYIVFEKNNLRKLDVYQELLQLPEGIYNVKELSQQFKFSYGKMSAIVNQINSDIQLCTEDKQKLIKDGKVHVNEKRLPSYDSLSKYLLVNDISFRFLISVLLKDCIDLPDFCEKNFISESSLRRKLVNLKKYLKIFGIEIRFSRVELIGDERLIRNILYYFLWRGSSGENLPINVLDGAEVDAAWEAMLPVSVEESYFVDRKKRKFYAEIMALRIKAGCFVKDEIYYDAVINEAMTENVQAWQNLLKIPSRHLEAEARYACFSFICEYINTEEQAEAFIKGVTEYPFIEGFKQQLEALLIKEVGEIDEVCSAKGDCRILLANLLSIYYRYFLFKQRLPLFIYLEDVEWLDQSETFQRLFITVEKFFNRQVRKEQNSWMKLSTYDMTKVFAYTIFPLYEENRKEKLHVTLLTDGTFFYIRKVLSYLKKIDFIQTSPYNPEKIDSYDVIICSSEVGLEEFDVERICFPITFDEGQYLSLHEQLARIYKSRIKRKKNRVPTVLDRV